MLPGIIVTAGNICSESLIILTARNTKEAAPDISHSDLKASLHDSEPAVGGTTVLPQCYMQTENPWNVPYENKMYQISEENFLLFVILVWLKREDIPSLMNECKERHHRNLHLPSIAKATTQGATPTSTAVWQLSPSPVTGQLKCQHRARSCIFIVTPETLLINKP